MTTELDTVFDPRARKVKDIFGTPESYYYIPEYQRLYNWDDEHIEELFDNLISSVEENKELYFLGPMILAKPKNNPTRGFEVIDGQQRLTTLTILFCVYRDYFFGDGNTIGDELKKDVKDSIESFRTNRYRLLTQIQNQNQFEAEILRKVVLPDRELTEKEKKNKFINTAWYFRKEIDDLIPEKREKLLDFILNKTVLITITCSTPAFAIKLFLTLNNTGLDLSQSDLLHTYLYDKCPEDKRAQFNSTWNDVEKLSKAMDETLDKLLTYHAYYLLAKNLKESLYAELEDQFEKRNPNEVLYEFKSFVDCYNDLFSSEDRVIYSFYYLPNQVFWKSVLTTAKNLKYPEFNDLCIELRRMYYLFWIAGYTSTKTKQLSFNLIKWLKEGKNLTYLKDEINKKMIDEKVLSRAKENLQDAAYDASWARPLLVLLEYEVDDLAKISYIELNNQLHVDHILPKEWKAYEEWKCQWNDDDAKNWLNKLGNLTLLSGKKNIAQKNKPPKDKAEMYKKGKGGQTAFEMSKRVIPTLEKGSWGAIEAKERHEWIIEQVNRLFDLDSSK